MHINTQHRRTIDHRGGYLRTQINREPIAAQHAGQPGGALYTYEDSDIDGGTVFRYELALLMSDGGTTLLELGEVRVGTQTFLPLISN